MALPLGHEYRNQKKRASMCTVAAGVHYVCNCNMPRGRFLCTCWLQTSRRILERLRARACYTQHKVRLFILVGIHQSSHNCRHYFLSPHRLIDATLLLASRYLSVFVHLSAQREYRQWLNIWTHVTANMGRQGYHYLLWGFTRNSCADCSQVDKVLAVHFHSWSSPATQTPVGVVLLFKYPLQGSHLSVCIRTKYIRAIWFEWAAFGG